MKLRLLVSRGSGGGAADGPQRPSGPIKGLIQIVADDYAENAGTPEQPQTKDGRVWVKEVADEMVVVACDDIQDPDQIYRSLEHVIQVFMARTGALPTLEVVAQTQNALTTLPGAVEAILKSLPLIRALVPHVLNKVDMDQFHRAVEQVHNGQETVRAVEPLVHGATALVTQGQRYLDEQVRKLFKSLDPEMKANFTLNRDLEKLREHIEGPSQTGQATRQLTETVAHKTEAETLDRVRQVLGETGSSGQPPPTGSGGPGTGPGKPPTPSLPAPKHPAPNRKGARKGTKGTPHTKTTK